MMSTRATTPLRVALISAEYPPRPGGVGDYTQQLGRALAARGHTVFVFTIHESRFTIYHVSSPSLDPPSTVDLRPAGWGWRSWRAVRTALAATRPDLLHIEYQTGAYGMHPAINLLPWRLRQSQHRPRVVVTAHDLLLPYLLPKAGALRRWVTRRLLRAADAVIVTNAADIAAAAGYCGPASQPVLIPIGSNIAVAPPPEYAREAWRTRLGADSATTLVAYFGLISRTKGLETLIDALGRLPSTVRLLLIGGAATTAEDRAYAAAIERQIAERGLGTRVQRTGHCAPAEVSAYLLAADIAALPFSDGASFRRGSLLAALAHGLPVITTAPAGALPSAPARLGDGANMLLVPAGDAPSLAQAIGRLQRDPQLCERLRQGGQALARQFSWEAIAEQHDVLYHQLARR